MESLEIARLLREAFPQEVLDIQEFRGQAAVLLRHGRILDVLVYAREHFDMHVTVEHLVSDTQQAFAVFAAN